MHIVPAICYGVASSICRRPPSSQILSSLFQSSTNKSCTKTEVESSLYTKCHVFGGMVVVVF